MTVTPAEEFVSVQTEGGIATIQLNRGKVNALIPEVLAQCNAAIDQVEATDARAIVLTGHGPFFSFGFDVPHMYDWPREKFHPFITAFCDLYRRLFLLPIPVIAAINGHAVAGGCMIALAADVRIMVDGNGKVSLNEITFGANVFAGLVAMLRNLVPGQTAARILYHGETFSAQDAASLGLVDQLVTAKDLMQVAGRHARQLAKNPEAFASIKSMLRASTGSHMAAVEPGSIEAFLDIWYSEETRRQTADITIR
ncbi:MAG: enoyl-CoA hydratase/isomerase family protein [Planctomycetota bacterium]